MKSPEDDRKDNWERLAADEFGQGYADSDAIYDQLPTARQGGSVPMYSAKVGVTNNTRKPRIVWVEPWAEDYTLLPGEVLEITSRSDKDQPSFHVVEWEHSSQVYIESGSGDYAVIQDGKRLQCGHNRQAALDAGLPL